MSWFSSFTLIEVCLTLCSKTTSIMILIDKSRSQFACTIYKYPPFSSTRYTCTSLNFDST